MVENLVLNGPYSNKDFFNFITTSQEPRHRWYYFKEGFSSNVVTEALSSKATKNNKLRILDIFNGCGTTALTSALQKHYAVGIEINPFLEFTTKVKTNSYRFKKETFFQYVHQIIEKSRSGCFSELEGVSTFTSHAQNEKWLFNTSVIRRYSAMLNVIDELPNSYHQVFKFLALSSIIECCNAKKDGKSLRYKKDWKEIKYSTKSVADQFQLKANMFFDDIQKAPIVKDFKPDIYLGDSRKIIPTKLNLVEKFDLIVTSPPYLNSFDYSDIYRAELFLGGFVKDNSDLTKLRHQTLRSHVQVNWDKTISFESKMLAPYIEAMNKNGSSWNPRISLMVSAYFDDMHLVLKNSKKTLRRGGEVWLVVSTSAYSGVHIPVDLLIADLACQCGYKLKGIHCLRYLRTSSQQYKELSVDKAPLRESLIILQN